MPAAGPVDAFIESQPAPVRPLLQATREFLHDSAPGLTEAIKWRMPTFMQEKNRFYLNPEPDHVILGFTDGAKMDEHRGVFDQVKEEVALVHIWTVDDLKRPGLREAVRAAAGFRN
jgi:hypothetical protein